jgi:DNA-3-methyladenine glycosylase
MKKQKANMLTMAFFNRPTIKVAEDLIGCSLARRRGGKIERFMITETEAYDGWKDMASHVSHGKTKRNEIMFRLAGHIYVYFTYGMHWMLNIVTGPKDYPAAVLIRGVENLKNSVALNGPAR